MEDQDIIALYFARDEKAIRETADKYGDFCESVAMGILGNRQDAEECVSDTYLRTWNSIPPKRPSSLKAFLGKIARNLSIDRLRHRHIARHDSDLEIMLSELEPYLPAREEEESTLTEGTFIKVQYAKLELVEDSLWGSYVYLVITDYR
jgi:RNA polymerase sigma-70 factor (ECF subfamily)